MRITRAGSQPSRPGPAEWFTGRVRLDAPITTEAPARLAGALVTYQRTTASWRDHHRRAGRVGGQSFAQDSPTRTVRTTASGGTSFRSTPTG